MLHAVSRSCSTGYRWSSTLIERHMLLLSCTSNTDLLSQLEGEHDPVYLWKPKDKNMMAAPIAQTNQNDSSSPSPSPHPLTSTKVLIRPLSGLLISAGCFTWSFRSYDSLKRRKEVGRRILGKIRRPRVADLALTPSRGVHRK